MFYKYRKAFSLRDKRGTFSNIEIDLQFLKHLNLRPECLKLFPNNHWQGRQL